MKSRISAAPAPAAGLLLLAIVAVALNLRPVMAVQGPLLDLIERETGMGSAAAGLLTTLPVAMMGLGALAGGRLRRLLGERVGIVLGTLLVALACAARLLLPSTAGLLGSAAAAGLGIALVQALMPGVLKASFGAGAGRAMGLYTTGIMGGAAVAAASAAGVAAQLGWQAGLALWAVPAAAAALLWWRAAPAARGAGVGLQARSTPAVWRLPRAWSLMLFFGLGTGAYTLVLAWLPPYYVGLGQSRAAGGLLLAGLTVAEVVSGLLVSAFIHRFPDRRVPLAAVLLSLLAGLGCLIVAPLALMAPAVLLTGLGIGALFPLSLILALDHVDDAQGASELTAFVQGGGYLVASLMPVVAGLIRERLADLTQAWVLMALGVLLMLALVLRFAPRSCRLFGPRPAQAAACAAKA